MRKMVLAALMTGVALPIAFENKAGWKMDGDNLAKDTNGNPIYIDADGREITTEAATIGRLNGEAKANRERYEKAEKALESFKGIDVEAAKKAIDTVSKIDAKTLIDAGEVDKVRDTIKAEFTGQLNEKDAALKEALGMVDNMRIDKVFSDSDFVRDRLAMPRDFFEGAMRNHFKVEEGKVVAYDRSGNRLMSKKAPGDYASPEEALDLLVEMHPQKDTILKAQGGAGSGNGGGGGGRGAGRRLSRADFDALGPNDKAAAAGAIQKGELTVFDN